MKYEPSMNIKWTNPRPFLLYHYVCRLLLFKHNAECITYKESTDITFFNARYTPHFELLRSIDSTVYLWYIFQFLPIENKIHERILLDLQHIPRQT